MSWFFLLVWLGWYEHSWHDALLGWINLRKQRRNSASWRLTTYICRNKLKYIANDLESVLLKKAYLFGMNAKAHCIDVTTWASWRLKSNATLLYVQQTVKNNNSDARTPLTKGRERISIAWFTLLLLTLLTRRNWFIGRWSMIQNAICVQIAGLVGCIQ